MENMKPRLMPEDEDMLKRNFCGRVLVNEDTDEFYIEIRQKYMDLAEYICGAMLPDKERDLALTKLEESYMWMIACVDRRGYELVLEIEEMK